MATWTAAAFGNGATASLTALAPAPAGVAAGDLLLMWVDGSYTPLTFSCPGWTAVTASTGQNQACQLLYKTADSTDVSLAGSSGSYTVTMSGATNRSIAGIIADVPGASFDPGTPASSGQLGAAPSASVPVTGLTTGSSGDLLLWFGCTRVASGLVPSITPPSGFTAAVTQLSTTAAAVNVGVILATQTQVSAGATGTLTGTLSGNSDGGGLLVALSVSAAVPAAGAAMLSGSGSMLAAAVQRPSVQMSGTGTLAPPAVRTGAAVQASGAGTLLAGGPRMSAAALSGSGTLLGAVSGAGTAQMSGTGTLAAGPVLSSGASLSGSGSLAPSLPASAAAVLSGNGALSGAVRQGPGVSGTGTGSLAAPGAFAAGVTMSGTGTAAPVPGTSWMSNSSYITSLYAADPATASLFFSSPLSFSIGTSQSAPGSLPSGFTTTPVLKYIAYGQFLADVTGSAQTVSGVTYTPVAVNAAYQWLMYDLEDWSTNPPSPYVSAAAQAEVDDPWTYMGNFTALAHSHGYKVILAPGRDLGNDATSVNPLNTGSGETLDQWYVLTNIAGTAAATGAEIVHIQAQADQGTANYASFWASTCAQVRAAAGGSGTIVSAGVSTTSPATVTAAQMAASAQSVISTAEGFWLNTTAATISMADSFLLLMLGSTAGGAVLSGTGALAAAASRLPAVTLSGAGSASAGPVLAAGAALAGSGTMASAQAQAPAVTLSGSGTLAPAVSWPSGAALSGSGSLLSPPAQEPAALLSGSGALGTVLSQGPAAALSGTGVLAAGPSWPGPSLLSGSGSLTAGVSQEPGAVLAGSGAASAGGAAAGAAALSGTGSLGSAVTSPAGSALSGSGVLALMAVQAPVTGLGGSGSLSAGVSLNQAVSALLSGTGGLATGIAADVLVILSGSGSLSAVFSQNPGVSLSGSGALSTMLSQGAGASLSGLGTMGAATAAQASAVLSGTGTAAVAASISRPGAAVLSGSGLLTVLTAGMTVVTDSDSAHGEDSGFTYVTDSDTCTGTDAGGSTPLLVISGADACTGADGGEAAARPAGAVVTDSDTCTGTEAVTDIGIWTYMAGFMTTAAGGFELVRYHPVTGERRVVLAGEHADAAVLRFAAELAKARAVEFVSSSDGCRAAEREQPCLGVSVTVSPALEVSVAVSAARVPVPA